MKKLFFKQGIRSIFKNKSQLIVLLLLTFLFSFIFTSWLTIKLNIDNSFLSSTANFNKPDYVFTEKISNANSSLDQTKNQFVPLYDIIDNDGIENQFISFQNGEEIETDNNFLLVNNDKETFLTQTFESENFKSIFENFFLNDTSFSYGKAVSSFNYSDKNPALMIEKEKYKIDPSLSYKDQPNIYKKFIFNTIQLLSKNYLNDFNSDYLSGTVFHEYLNNNPDEKEVFLSDINYFLNSKVSDNLSIFDSNDHYLISYFLNSLEIIPIVIINNLNLYYENMLGNFIDNNDSDNYDTSKLFIENYQTYFNGIERPKLDTYKYKLIDLFPPKSEEIAIRTNMESGYEYLFGSSLIEGSTTFANYINNSNVMTNFSVNDTNHLDFYNSFNYQNQFNGMHGYSNNFKTIITGNNITGIIFDQSEYLYARVSLKKTYASSIGGIDYKKNDYSFNKKNIFSIRTLHFKMVGDLTNVNVRIREESTAFDPISKINYRFVVVDDLNDLNILKGAKHLNDDEIYISQQFYENINEKDTYKINNYNLNINGIADDALTYFQFFDVEAPIIDKDTTCIVYLNKETLKNIFNYNDGNGLAMVSTNNYFLNGTSEEIKNFFNKTKWYVNDMVNNDYSKLNMKSFSESNWNMSWKFMNKISLFLTIIGLISVLVVAALVTYTLLITIGFTVKDNSIQIKNLIIQGITNKRISIMFIGYSILIVLFSFTLGYLLGSICQIFFIKWFSSYIVINNRNVNFNWIVFLVLFILISSFIFLLNYFLTLYRVKKLSKIKVKKISRLFLPKRTPFTFKLNLIVLWKSKTEILILMLLTFFTSTILSTFSLSMTSIGKYIEDSKNTITYSNSYTMEDPIFNSPFSRKSLSVWNGLQSPKTLDSDLSDTVKTYYENTDDYESTVNNMSLLPKLIFVEGNNSNEKENIHWLDQYTVDNNKLIDTILKIFIENAANISNKAFSIGTFEEFQNYILHENNSKYNEKYGEAISTERKNDLDSFENFIGKAIPNIIKLIFGSFYDIDNSPDWREVLLSLARSLLPNSFSKNYTSDERKTQFFFAVNSENYVANKEDLATVSQISINNSNYKLTGLNEKQESFNLSNLPKTSMPFLSESELNDLKNIGSKDIFNHNGFKIYDKNTQTLNIPAVLSNDYYKKISGTNTLNISSNALSLKNVGVLPKNSWTYAAFDETSFNNSNNWLNLDDLPVSKFNYTKEYDNNYNLLNNAQLFADYLVDGNIVRKVIRTYYNYNKIMLMIPKSYFNGENEFKKNVMPNNYTIANDRFFNIKSKNDLENLYQNWYGEIDNSIVPESVKDAWNDYNDDYYWVAPYNLNYSVNFSQSENGDPSLIDVTLGSINNWFDDALNRTQSPLYISLTTPKVKNVKKINLVSIGNINSYDQDLAIVDQNLLNIALGYGSSLTITKPISSIGQTVGSYNSGDIEIPIYNKKNPLDLEKELDSFANLYDNDYVKTSWFNTKLSRIDEPLNLTAGLSGSLNKNIGVGLLLHDGISNIKSGYTSIDLESLKLKTIISISTISISIGMFVFVGIIIISILIFFIISDIYTNRHKQMMNLLKIQGYSNFISTWIVTLPQVSTFLISLFLSSFIPLFLVPIILNLFNDFDVSINVWSNFFIQSAVLIIIIVSFLIGSIFSIRRVNKMKLTLQKFD